MVNEHAPRMSNEEYFRCLETAANARSADEVRRIRSEVSRKYHGDPRADDLCEALYAHATRFEGRELGADGWGLGIDRSDRVSERGRAERTW